MTEPQHRGSWHWLEAERLLLLADDPDVTTTASDWMMRKAALHASLAQSAPLYAWHQAPAGVVADSPNILKGQNEGPVPMAGTDR